MNRSLVSEWQQLSALYDQADALAERERTAWLESLAAQSHPLLPQLEQMLAARSQARQSRFLEALPKLTAGTEPKTPAGACDRRVGPYRLRSHLGSGGMSEVWLAQRDDGAFERQVAIKLLSCHAGLDLRDSFSQRFARERDILAALHHPNIACLHDAGVTEDGQPWLALEYVEGLTLTQWCDSKRLQVAARIRLFQQVLRAVQHAHSNLVIHRDLKPANILVTTQGEVRLLDFGIAKFMVSEADGMVDSELTRQAGRPLTLQYASPEQLLGKPLTTSCDVYSLGVVLYELLCGELPYEYSRNSAAQLEHAVIHTDARAPGRRALLEATVQARSTSRDTLRKTLCGDLGAVMLKALAKQPAQRYASVDAFNADLACWLSGQTVQARTPSAAYRVGKFVRRHKLSALLGSSAIASLLAIAVVAVLLGQRAQRESARAFAARDFMLHIFQRANQERSRGTEITARELLETGRRDVLIRLAGQPELQAEILRGIANVQSDMGDYVNADATLGELVQIYMSALRQPREESMARADQAYNALQMNNVVWAQRRLADAQAVPGRPLADPELNARMDEVVGRIAMGQGDVKLARNVFANARKNAVSALGEDDIRTFKLGKLLLTAEREMHDFDAALGLYPELRKHALQIADFDKREIAALDLENVHLLLSAGKIVGAMSEVEIALPKCIELVGSMDQSCRLMFLDKMQILLRLGFMDRAMGFIETLTQVGEEVNMPYLRIEALLLEFRIRSRQKSFRAQSDQLFEKIREFGQSGDEVQMKSTFKSAALLAIAESQLRLNEPIKARFWAELALNRLGPEVDQGGGARMAAIGHMLVGISLMQIGDLQEAVDKFKYAETKLLKAFGPQHPALALFSLNRALALERLDKTSEALSLIRQFDPILIDSLGQDSPTYKSIATVKSRLEEHRKNLVRDEKINPKSSDELDRFKNLSLEFFS